MKLDRASRDKVETAVCSMMYNTQYLPVKIDLEEINLGWRGSQISGLLIFQFLLCLVSANQSVLFFEDGKTKQ